jgi:hypothetical protein
MNTTNPERLKNVIRLLNWKKPEIDAFFNAYIFRPYGVDIENCLLNEDVGGAKKLLDFSFTTRQGGQTRSAIQNYERKKEEIVKKLKGALAGLKSDNYEPTKRYEISLALINSVEDVGQKIASMFLKFTVYYSRDFPGKKAMERELFIPFDSHVLRLLFTEFNGERTNRLDLYDESVNQAALHFEIETLQPLVLKNTKLLRLQRNIREDFDELGIKEPPIMLDYLWYVGNMYCSRRFGNLGCEVCFVGQECKYHLLEK